MIIPELLDTNYIEKKARPENGSSTDLKTMEI